MSKYDDIINLPHWNPKSHPRMSEYERAAQFAPFAALTGYDAMVSETARLTDAREDLDEEQIMALNEALSAIVGRLNEHPKVAVTWFRKDARKKGGEYVRTEGILKDVDLVGRLLILKDGTRIPLDDVSTFRESLAEVQLNPEVRAYIEEKIVPQYRAFDPAHRIDHVRSVIDNALKMSRFYSVDADMLAIAAACHDLGLCEDRKTHHLVSGRIIRADAELRRWFNEEKIETIAQAAEDHRASSDHEPRSIYGRIVAEADRQIIPETVIKRTIQYGLEHYPELDMEGHWQRTLEHLHEKYAEGGYLKLWIPESLNAQNLTKLREIIRDEVRLRAVFEEIYWHFRE